MGIRPPPRFREYDGKVVLNGEGTDMGNIGTINFDGSEPKQISQHGEDAQPYWSPGGDRLVYVTETENRQGDAPRISCVFTLDSVEVSNPGKGLRVMDRGSVPGRSPVWLDNDWIVYTGCNFWAGNGSCGMFTVPSWGGDEARQITTSPDDMATDAFGELIAFSCHPGDTWDICSVNFDGSNLANLTEGPGNEGLATFSPDGSKIAFLSDRTGGWAVWVTSVDGSNPVKAFDLPGSMGDDWLGERISWWGE